MTYETDDEWVERPATHGPDGQPLAPVYHCAKCNRCLPPSMFKRYFTPAEAKYRGYSGERRVQIETENCSDCRLRRRTHPNAFTSSELRRKAARGEINEGLVKSITTRRDLDARRTMAAAATKRWDLEVQRPWREMLDEIRHEVRVVTHQRKHAATRGKEGQRSVVLAYTHAYLDLLRRLRADLTLTMRRTKIKAGDTRWQDHATHQEKEGIARLWGAIEPNHAAKMRPPALFKAAGAGVFDRPHIPHIPDTPAQPDTPPDTTPTQPAPETTDNWWDNP